MPNLDIHPASPYAAASPLPEVHDTLDQPTREIRPGELEIYRPYLPAMEQYESPPTVPLMLPSYLGKKPRAVPPLAWVALVIAVAAAIALAVVGLPEPGIPAVGCRVDVCAGVPRG